ncbi:MAG: thiamine-phosphate kinase [Gemmatimonas sp.]
MSPAADTPDALPGEFDLIARYFAPIARAYPGALGLTDDAAFLDLPAGHQMVATVDAMVAGVHFLADDPPDLIARKLMRVNLSDLAAKAATPVGCLLALSLPRETTAAWIEAFARGLASDCAEFAMPLVGGDTTATDGPLTISLTALGAIRSGRAPLRSGAKVGDRVFVSGTIGDGALGLEVAKGGLKDLAEPLREHLLRRYRLPEPKTALAPVLREFAHSAIDVSDGLLADLGHICETSGVGAVIQAAMVPMSDGVQIAIARDPALLARVLAGGDDYEIVFTADPAHSDRVVEAGIKVGVPITGIGFVVERPAEGPLVKVGDLTALDMVLRASTGYRHF